MDFYLKVPQNLEKDKNGVAVLHGESKHSRPISKARFRDTSESFYNAFSGGSRGRGDLKSVIDKLGALSAKVGKENLFPGSRPSSYYYNL